MIANLYELKKMNHAEEIIHYLKKLVVPRSIARNMQGNPINKSPEHTTVLTERIVPIVSFTQIRNRSTDEGVPVQLII